MGSRVQVPSALTNKIKYLDQNRRSDKRARVYPVSTNELPPYPLRGIEP